MNRKQFLWLFSTLVVLLLTAFSGAWVASDWLLAKATPPKMHEVTDDRDGGDW